MVCNNANIELIPGPAQLADKLELDGGLGTRLPCHLRHSGLVLTLAGKGFAGVWLRETIQCLSVPSRW